MESNYDILIRKLDFFIRKYYKNLLIKGLLLSLGMVVTFFIAVNILEYFAWFNPIVRTCLFLLFILIISGITGYFIINPLLKLYRIGSIITHQHAAEIIGKHFAEVKDKLLNTLQLKDISLTNSGNIELIEASIDQKITLLKPVSFTKAINIKQNKKYLKYALPPLIILMAILLTAPGLVTGPATRIIHFSKAFKRKLPYDFVIENKTLLAIQQEDFLLYVGIKGDEIPDKIYIEYNNSVYEMKKDGKIRYSFLFKNLQKNLKFKIKTEILASELYEIKVLPKPIILNFDVALTYPSYTGKADEVLQNIGDQVVPEGTNISWKFFTRDTRQIFLTFEESKFTLDNNSKNYFYYQRYFYKNETYSLIPSNPYMENRDSLIFNITVIKDAYPSIELKTFEDSILPGRKFFTGNIKDDYGFKKLKFVISKKLLNSKDTVIASNELNINLKQNQQSYYHYFDFSTLNLLPGEQAEYYFEVWDNDAVNGSKSAKTIISAFKLPTREEVKKEEEKSDNSLKDQMEDAINDLNKLIKQADELQKKLIDKKNISWQEKKQLEDILNKQKELEEKINEIQKKYNENTLKQQEYNKENEDIIEKQKELEKLFQDVLPDEMKKQLMELQKLMEELDKDKMKNVLDKIKLNNEDIKKELDRNLELFKQLEIEKRMKDAIDKLTDIKNQQQKLSEQNIQSKDELSKMVDKQDSLNKKFDTFSQDMQKLKDLNNKLENPNPIPDTKEEQNNIGEKMQNASDQMKNNNQKKGKQNQKEAKEKMEDMIKQMEQAQEKMEEESLEEDEQSLRGILENLLKASFKQEELMANLNSTNYKDPRLNKIIQEQKDLRDDLQIVEDSLFALSKRQPMIKAIVNREINNINQKADLVLESLKDMRKSQAVKDQQYIMQSINELALILAESLQEMQNKQQSSSQSCNKKGGKCKKPGNSKSSMKTMKQMQEELNKQMGEMRKKMQEGKQKGQYPKNMSEQLAKLAAQQEAIRKMMQDYSNRLKEETGGTDNNLNKMLQDMQKSEEEIVNKNLNPETIKRQQEILTRMLESEKAEKERDKEEKRESTEGKDINNSNKNQFLEYNRLKKKEDEILKTVPPSLNTFYKQKLEEYYLKIE